MHMTKILHAPYRYDAVGSLLRPAYLKEAKQQYKDGLISALSYEQTVQRAIREAVEKQKELGYRIISDGEFHRSFWHLDFMWGIDGIEHKERGSFVSFAGEPAFVEDTYLVDKLHAPALHPFVSHFQFLKELEDESCVAKFTIPAPAQLYQQLIVPGNYEKTKAIYSSDKDLILDIAMVYGDIISQFYQAGCRNLQLDDCTWGAVVGDAAKQRYQALGIDLEEVKQTLLLVNTLALNQKPKDMTITSHICRGNYHSTYFSSGSYDSIADYVFAEEPVDALYLEYDNERSGSFAPLSKVSPDKSVVLGLITTKSPVMEDMNTIIEKIHEAARFIPYDRLCISPQCGFASCEIGNKLTEADQWAKLRLVRDIAKEIWNV